MNRPTHAVIICAAMFCGQLARAETFDNNSIIALVQAGVGDGVLISKISGLPCSYDVSTDQIIKLKGAGVSNDVITEMVGRCTGSSRAQGADDSSSNPNVKRASGIYIQQNKDGKDVIHVIRPTKISGLSTRGNGSILFPYIAELSLPQESAQTVSPGSRPTFYFYFEPTDSKVGDFGSSTTAAAQSPSEFSLIRFKVKSGQRQMMIGKVMPFKSVAGIDPKNTIQFSMDEIGDSIFKVFPKAALASGQYAFALRAGSDAYRIYDFEVN
jgi:hypothetical protein